MSDAFRRGCRYTERGHSVSRTRRWAGCNLLFCNKPFGKRGRAGRTSPSRAASTLLHYLPSLLRAPRSRNPGAFPPLSLSLSCLFAYRKYTAVTRFASHQGDRPRHPRRLHRCAGEHVQPVAIASRNMDLSWLSLPFPRSSRLRNVCAFWKQACRSPSLSGTPIFTMNSWRGYRRIIPARW